MHISRVELENIKSHSSSSFRFERGTTAIKGENGAGKTTIIEAIAWVLFDLLDYKKDDFLRRGTKKGSASVTFESSLDERKYVAFRDTGLAYHVTDPRLGIRVADKKEEVFRFLWQHLGLEPGTDLKSLFRQAIGVPQGTFTAIFLEGATDRKIAFDRLLKVEEYRQAAEKLRDTSKFLDSSIRDVRETIAHAEGELARSDDVATEAKLVTETVSLLTVDIERLNAELTEKQTAVSELNKKEKRLSEAKTVYERTRAESEKARVVAAQAEQNYSRSVEAAATIERVKREYHEHTAALATLKGLESRRSERDRLRTDADNIESQSATLDAEQKRLTLELGVVGKAKEEIESLRPPVARQTELDAEIERLRRVLADARSAAEMMTERLARRVRLRLAYQTNGDDLKRARQKAALAGELIGLETRNGELVKSLANLQASLERDEKFQSEIQNGLCPILSGKCLNLAEGQTLEDFVTSQFSELRTQIGVVETERSSINERLALARDAAKMAAVIDVLEQRETDLRDDGIALTSEIVVLEQKSTGLAEIEKELTKAESEVAALDDPRGRGRLLERQVAREPEISNALRETESGLKQFAHERTRIAKELDGFADLETEWSKAAARREATADAYRLFIANEKDAESIESRRKESEAANTELSGLVTAVTDTEKAFREATAGYDREKHDAERASLLDAQRRHAESTARNVAAKTRSDQLAAELQRFAELRKSLAGEFRDKDRLETVAETTKFIRDTLKEAAPRVARNYVHHVSIEANTMFREITGNAEVSLRWAEDYSIVLEEDGYERPYVSLSGGEQMSAALAIRLGLLKQLSDIRIAFFDEPTTNMDAERRENFAMQISRISHFDQLFVISHDETFDNYVDHVVSLD